MAEDGGRAGVQVARAVGLGGKLHWLRQHARQAGPPVASSQPPCVGGHYSALRTFPLLSQLAQCLRLPFTKQPGLTSLLARSYSALRPSTVSSGEGSASSVSSVMDAL